MNLKDILTISGQPGLYKVVTQGKSAIIVENLETGKRMPAHARYRISSLEDISVFTQAEDKPLKQILRDIFTKEEGKEIADPRKLSGDELKAYFVSVVPDYDQERVYTSDIKKALEWYNILLKKELIDMEEDTIDEENPETQDSDEKAD